MPRVAGQIDVAKTEAILDAAVEVIGQRGLGAPMEAIAKRAGVSKQTVYNHYGSKAELMRALMHRRVESITAPLRDPGAVDNPTETLEAYALSLLDTVITNKSYSMMRVIMLGAGEMPDVAQEVYEAGPASARRQLAAFLKAETELGRMKVEDFEQAAELFSGMVMGQSQMRSLLRLPSDKTPDQYRQLAREAAERFMKAYAA
jgi:TetR/AcrR family transcriptional repressor of mexJK operon